VALTATPADGWAFTGWTGACTGTGACSVTMNGPESVSASFTQVAYALTVANGGNGTVTSSPAGINCGSTCSASFNTVTLTATPADGYAFTGWGGVCSGSGATCTVTMSTAESVAVTFMATTPCTILAGYNNWLYVPAAKGADFYCDTTAGTAIFGAVSADDDQIYILYPTDSQHTYTISFELDSDGNTPNALTAIFGNYTMINQTNIIEGSSTYTGLNLNPSDGSDYTIISFSGLDNPGYLTLRNLSITPISK
jgi:hypothetical protein